MRITIDVDDMARRDIGVSGCLYLLSMWLGDRIGEKTFDALNGRGFVFTKEWLNNKPHVVVLDKSGEELVAELLEASGKKGPGKDFTSLAERLREVFPKGKKPLTNLQWRDSTPIIASRLRTLASRYPGCLDDEDLAVEAARAYVSSFSGDLTYMHVLRYFIFKNVTGGGDVERSSQLLSWMENAGDGDGDGGDGWTEGLR